jgi:enoyl-CoA hydratase/carnithine racemase
MSFVETSDRDGIRILRINHGKPNSISQQVAEELCSGLDEAGQAKDVRAVVLFGRAGMFSGGFDLATMGKGAEAARDMVIAGGRLAMDIYDHPKPVVVGCAGHAIAMGAFLVLAADERVGADGRFKLGMNETAIGMTLPEFGFELGRARLSKRHHDRVIVHSTILDPKAAVDAGILDRIVDPDRLEEEALAAAIRLGELKQPAFRNNKRIAHAETVERVRSNLVENISKMMGA